jgi:hypothetical protein
VRSMNAARVLEQMGELHDSSQTSVVGSSEHQMIYQRVLSVLRRIRSVEKKLECCDRNELKRLILPDRWLASDLVVPKDDHRSASRQSDNLRSRYRLSLCKYFVSQPQGPSKTRNLGGRVGSLDYRSRDLWNIGDVNAAMDKIALTIVNLLRDAEVGYLDAALVIDKDVATFDVPVDDISFVQVIETCQDLANKVLHEGFFKCTIVV